MAKSYCKWPVIAGIVVGSIILISVITCIARCIFCGAECAICCCKCCTCCCSGGGGRSSGHKRMKSEPTPSYPVYPTAGQPNPYAQAHAAAPPAPPIDNRPFQQQQYRSHATPAFTPAQEAPQFATFDTNRKPVNEDSLPAMPSWGDARDVHVQVEEPAVPEKRGDVEMDRLNHTGSATSGSMTGMAAVGAGNARRSPGPGRSPMQRTPTNESYGYNQQGFENEPLVGGPGSRSPHPSPGPYHDRPYGQQDDYRRHGSPAQNLSPVYGAGEGYTRRSPQPYNESRDPYSDTSYNTHHQDTTNTSYTQMPEPGRYDSPPPPSYHTNANTGNHAPYDNFAPAQGITRAHTSPTYNDHVDATPAPQPVSAYPGQRSYTPQSSAYPGQTSYQAFNPGQTGPQYSGVTRKAVDGSTRDI